MATAKKQKKSKKTRKAKAVILAAGESSRFKPLSEGHHKALTRLHGKELIKHTAESVLKSGVEHIIVVHGPHEVEKFKEALKEFGNKVTYIVQPEPKGMGNALLHAGEHLDSPFFLLNADRHDAGKYIKLMMDRATEKDAQMVLLSTRTEKPGKYGMLGFDKKDPSRVIKVIEKPKPGEEPSNQRIIGVYFLPHDFLNYYKQVEEKQYAFEDTLDLYAQKNPVHAAFIDEEPSSTKHSFDLLDNAKALAASLKRKISPKAEIAKSAVIEGNVVIGEGTRILENAVIKGPVYIGKNCLVGNNSLIRDFTVLEDGVAIGMNTEVTRSIILDGTHVHSGFIGDSIIGKNCRIGANFIAANRRLDRGNVTFWCKGEPVDSKKSFLGCVIGHGTKIGINASTMPGTVIGSSCIVGAGTEVRGFIESNSTVYEEKNLKIKPNLPS